MGDGGKGQRARRNKVIRDNPQQGGGGGGGKKKVLVRLLGGK